MKTAHALPPGPRLPSILQLVEISRDPFGFLERCRDRYGDLFTVRQPGQPPTVVVCDPDGVRQLVSGGYDDFTRSADGIRFLLGDHAVIFQQDAQHRETRRLMVPPFHGERMRAYGADMARVTDGVIAGFRDGERRGLHKDMQDVTLGVILRSVFGLTDDARLGALGRLFIEYLDELLTPWFYGATLVLSGARVREFLRARGDRVRRGRASISHWPLQRVADRLGAIDGMLFDEIARCRALGGEERAGRSDILAMLVAARFDDGSAMSDDVLRDHLMTLLVGGHETTATALSWAVACALENPGTLEKMRAEVDAVMGAGFDPTRVKQLDYVGAVASESMRLYPIATAVSRQLKRPLRIAGRELAAGTIVQPSIYLTQRDPRVWDEPDAFRPERFLDGKASVYQFFPFGAGVWRCLGAQFAEYEMRVVLARLVAQIDLEREPGVEIRPAQRGFTVAPSDGLPVRVRRRRELGTGWTRSATATATATATAMPSAT
ncbi:MAG TPA: cytochrome P450 [Polyangia bacterium]|nr:cytochrome P450 [Polyangia bacterium]